MRGIIILAFFSLFTIASLLLPVPMFPGSWLCALIGQGVLDYVSILSAVFNGLFYGVILSIIFIGVGRKLVE